MRRHDRTVSVRCAVTIEQWYFDVKKIAFKALVKASDRWYVY